LHPKQHGMISNYFSYTDHKICSATAGHLDLILFSLFDPDVNLQIKQEMIHASTEKEGEANPLKRIHLDLATVKQKTLVDFVTKRSRNLFAMHGMPDGFLLEDPKTWNSREDYKAAESIAKTQPVTNDHAEQGVALIQEAAQSGRFKNEEICNMHCKLLNRIEQTFQMQRSLLFLENDQLIRLKNSFKTYRTN